jgi:hypothetical protein
MLPGRVPTPPPPPMFPRPRSYPRVPPSPPPPPTTLRGDALQPKNFITTGTKKGHFGTVGTTIAKIPEYVPEPYDAHRLEVQRKAIEDMKAAKDRPRYITTCQSVGRTTLDVPEHARTTSGKVRMPSRGGGASVFVGTWVHGCVCA